MAILVKPRTEGAHWYTANGEPVHTRPNQNGHGEHNATLADARKLRLFPSVTNCLSILGKPGLEKWKISQVLLAMKRTPQQEKEADEVYFDRVVNAAFEQVDVAQHTGTGIHQAMMAALQGRPVPDHYKPYVDKVFAYFDKEGIVCQTSEQVIVNHEVGFAGTMDFAGTRAGEPLVLDWKTRKTKPGKPIVSYEVQPMQVAAYGATFWKTRWPHVLGGNIYISSTEPGRIELIPYTMERMLAEWEAFCYIAYLWRHLSGYDPRTAGTAAETEGPEIAKERYQNIVISDPMDGAKALVPFQKPQAEAPAIDIAKPVPKQKERPKRAQDKGKKKAAKPSKPKATKAEKKFEMGVLMPVGKYKGEYIANIPDAELKKLWKFGRKSLSKHADAFDAVKVRVNG